MRLWNKIVVFLSGFLVMVVEMFTPRLLVPFFGSSFLVWNLNTAIALLGLALGYLVSAKTKIVKLSLRETAGFTWLATGFFLGWIVFGVDNWLPVFEGIKQIETAIILSGVVIFLPFYILMGYVYPLLSEMEKNQNDSTREVVGDMSTLSALGSIFGVLFYTFALVPYFETRTILVILVGISLVISIVFLQKFSGKLLMVLALVALMMTTEKKELGTIDTKDSIYNKIKVIESINLKNGRPIIKLVTGRHEVQTSMYLDKPSELADEYKLVMATPTCLDREYKNLLFIGGGGYALPKYFGEKYPYAKMTVVEIDKEIEKMARKHFELSKYPNVQSFTLDGRRFLKQNQDQKYEGIFLDAFSGNIGVPFHLTTKEAFEEMKVVLGKEGFLVMNIIASPEKEGKKYFEAQKETIRAVFGNVMTILVQNPEDQSRLQNIVLGAFLDEKTKVEFESCLQENGKQKNILRDKYAPVEYFLLDAFEYVHKV